MVSTFNPQILVEKLAKLNSSQQSIETLSHWCIFHMNKAKLVVETWERQFHNSPREQRLAFLYLANDILQNSRRKGAEFVAEFWRVLPEALRDVIHNGDEFGKNAALRLISIWDERKVFGSRGHILKEEFMGRQPDNNVNKTGRQISVKLKQSTENMLDKIVSDFEIIYGGQLDEDVLLTRCTNTDNSLEKVIKDIGGGINSGNVCASGFLEELQAQHAALRECIEQLTTLEASRSSLVSHLREALQEQDSKLDQVRSQLQAAQLRSDQIANICRQFVTSDNMLLDEQGLKEARASSLPPGFTPIERQENAVVYTRQVPLVDKTSSTDEESRKSAAAAVAAQLANSSSSAEMLSHVLTSFVSGVGFGNNGKESPSDHHHLEKRPKLENEASSYAPPPPPLPPQNQQPPPPLPPFLHPETLAPNANTPPTNHHSTAGEQPPPPSSSPPPLPPLPPIPLYPMAPQFIQTAGSMSNVAYSYGAIQQIPPPLSGYPAVHVTGMSPYGPPPVNPYQPFPGSEGGFYSPPSSVPMAPISRQQTF